MLLESHAADAATFETLDDARIAPADVDVVHVGNFAGELFNFQGQLGGLVAAVHHDLAGKPASRHEAACASGSMAVLAAMADLESGRYDTALVLGAEVLRNVPEGFGAASFGETTRRPVLIVSHMADLMAWAVRMTRGEMTWKAEGSEDWDTEIRRFFDHLASLDAALATEGPFAGSVEKLIQGPLADALTHVGQLALLRGLAGAPVRPESYARAEIVAGRVGMEQVAPAREFDGDASVPR